MGSNIGDGEPLNPPERLVSGPNVAEAHRYAESLKLYKRQDEEDGGEGREMGDEKSSLLGGPARTRFSMFSDPQDWHGVSAAVIAYFNFHYLMCLIMFGNALVALPALVTYMSQGFNTGIWGWTTIGNMGAGTVQPIYVVTIDIAYFAIVLSYLSWKFQNQHIRMQDVHLNLPPRAADYTLIVSIPIILTDPTKLKPHFEKWGEVSAVVIPFDTKNKSADSKRTFIPSIGQAFVTFTYHRDAIKCLNECNRRFFRWVWRYLCSLGLPAEFDINTCRIRPAPDPSDLVFENLRYSDLHKAAFFIAGALAITVALIGNLVLLYFLLNFEYVYLSNKSGLLNTIILLLFSRWLAILNWLMKRFSFFYVDLMRVNTKTTQSFLRLAIIVASQILNGGIILLVANFFIYHNADTFTLQWFVIIAQPIILLVLTNPIVSFFQSIVKPGYFVRSRLRARWATTQQELNNCLAPPEFMLSDAYSMLLVSAFITFMFSYGFPLLPIVTCILFFCKYWLEKYNLLRCCTRPSEASLWPFSFISVEVLLLGITAKTGFGLAVTFMMAMNSLSAMSLEAALELGSYVLLPLLYLLIYILMSTPFRYFYLLKMFIRSRIYVPKHIYQSYSSVAGIGTYILPNSFYSDFKVVESEPVQSNHFSNYWINPAPSHEQQESISPLTSHVSISDGATKEIKNKK